MNDIFYIYNLPWKIANSINEDDSINIDESNGVINLKSNSSNSFKELKFQFSGVFVGSNNSQAHIYNTIAKEVIYSLTLFIIMFFDMF